MFLVDWVFLSVFGGLTLAIMLMSVIVLSLLVDLARLGLGMGVSHKGCPLSLLFTVTLYLLWCGALHSIPFVWPQLYADNLKCVWFFCCAIQCCYVY